MTSYYNDVIGNIQMGDIAKAEDINAIQDNIKDALKSLLTELHNGESYVLGTDEEYKNSFRLKAAPKTLGKYIDSSNIFNIDDSTSDCLNINRFDVKQPILKSKTSLYSIITNFKNTSNKNIPITCELQDEDGTVLRTNTITLLANTPSSNYEIVFDLDYYPTPPNFDYETLKNRGGQDISSKGDEESQDEGYSEEEDDTDIERPFSAGVSKLFFVIKKAELNEADLSDNSNEAPVFDADNSLGVYCSETSDFAEKDIYAEVRGDLSYTSSGKNIYYQDIYAVEQTYLCTGGKAIIDGERVDCLDSHISIEGGSSLGNVITQVYLDNEGRLRASNKQASLSTEITDDFEENIQDPLPPKYLPIALILTYSNALYGTSKEPLIIQDSYRQLPRSHHERLRRLEKQMDWNNDFTLPSRIKYTINGKDWVDEEGELLANIPYTAPKKENGDDKKDGETLETDNVFLTTDEKGNIVVKVSDAVTQTIPVTLKEKTKDSDGKKIKFKDTDVLNVSSFSKIEHMVHDPKKGTIVLDKEKLGKVSVKKGTVSVKVTTEKSKNKKSAKQKKKEALKNFYKEQAEDTKYNPWDDSIANRPSGSSYKTTERRYTVHSGKNGSGDYQSSYPGMTFYAKKNMKFKKLNIPIRKFKNCESVRFYIWKRQDKNIKTNTVPNFKKKQLVYKSTVFSLKKAKVKNGKQYMDEGFTINFGKNGKSLEKGQYVIVAVPKPKSGVGHMYVRTFKPKNSKDFCIKYIGAANASHFKYKEAYQEVWFNPADAVVEPEDYCKKGTIISNTLKWEGTGLEKIESIKPIVGGNLKHNSTDSYKLSVNTGGKWIKVDPNKENKINDGGATSFKWKLEFEGNGETTPKLSYSSKKGYAIQFIIKRAKPGGWIKGKATEDLNKSMCVTSKPFDGDKILREYIGDMNFGLTDSRFEGYEFARVWANNVENENLLVDIQASDRSTNYDIKQGDNTISGDVDLWSLHYCDLTLDDFEKISVDYSDYESEIEYDENNLRLKLDSEHSYNDDDIQILALRDFVKKQNQIDINQESEEDSQTTTETDTEDTTTDTEDTTTNDEATVEVEEEKKVPSEYTMKFVNNDKVTENQCLMKKVFENPIDLTKYTGLKFKFSKNSEDTTAVDLNGIGIYLSTVETDGEVPSNKKNLPEEMYKDSILSDAETIPEIIDPDESSYPYYDGKIIKIIHSPTEKDGDKIYPEGFYQYVKKFDIEKNKYIWQKEQVFDLRSYNIYKLGPISYNDDKDTEFDARIEIDQDSNNLKYIKEIGIISLNDEKEFKVEDKTIKTEMSIESPSANKITVTLRDEAGVLLEGEELSYTLFNEKEDKEITSTGKTSSEDGKKGQMTLTNVKDNGTITFKFAGTKKTANHETKSYSASYIKASYDFEDTKTNVTELEKNSTGSSGFELTLESVRAISQEVLTIFNPEEKMSFTEKEDNDVVTIKKSGEITLNKDTYGTKSSMGGKDKIDVTKTSPETQQISIKYKDNTLKKANTLCYLNNPYKISKYQHIGVQISTDIYIPKDCLKINICAEEDGESPITSINLPTLNSIYYPIQSEQKINLNQIFKKIDIEDKEIKSISISVTEHFSDMINKVIDTENKTGINLFIGKIVLYRARTIPIYHKKMRFKFYNSVDGEIKHYNDEDIDSDVFSIRKIGAILDYN